MSPFSDNTTYLILFTLMLSIIIAKGTKKNDIATLDGLLSVIGFLFGLFMIVANFFYSSGELFLLSPLITISSLLYLRYRKKLLSDNKDINEHLSVTSLKKIDVLFWLFISIAVASYYISPLYSRSTIFFISISICVALISLFILFGSISSNSILLYTFLKILLLSSVLRASGYFISPYPVGSDPWVHAEYIKNFILNGNVSLDSKAMTYLSSYYLFYPLSHLFAAITSLVLNLNLKISIYLLGMVLTLSTIFTYLIAKKVINNTKIALFSLLLINFASCNIRWSIEVIAMSYGIAIYSFLIYLVVAKTKSNKFIYTLLSVLLLFTIIWAHTISSFICVISLTLLYLSFILISSKNIIKNNSLFINPPSINIDKDAINFSYLVLVQKSTHRLISYFRQIGRLILHLRTSVECQVNHSFIILALILLIFHWIDPKYPFFERNLSGFLASLNAEAKFLGPISSLNLISWESLLIYIGNMIYFFFGIIGALLYFSKKYRNPVNISLLFMIICLFILRYSFPLFGIRDIIPDRWPAFIMVSFTIFISVGFLKTVALFNSKHKKILFSIFILFISSIFMITSLESNRDSPLYAEGSNQKLIWTESEMTLFYRINEFYDGVIFTDLQTDSRPFKVYIHREPSKVTYYKLTAQGNIDYSSLTGSLIIWRKASIDRPVSMPNQIILGNEFKSNLDRKFDCIYDTGEAKSYI